MNKEQVGKCNITTSYLKPASGLPMTHDLRIFDALEPKFTPFKFKFVLCLEFTL